MNTDKYGLEYRIVPVYNENKEFVGNKTVWNKSFLKNRNRRYNPRTNKYEEVKHEWNFETK